MRMTVTAQANAEDRRRLEANPSKGLNVRSVRTECARRKFWANLLTKNRRADTSDEFNRDPDVEHGHNVHYLRIDDRWDDGEGIFRADRLSLESREQDRSLPRALAAVRLRSECRAGPEQR
jgi:hypothetical protein